MIRFRVWADVSEDRRVVLQLPPDVPPGKTELLVSVAEEASAQPKPPRSSLADWAAENAESWGDQIRSDDVESFTGRRY